MLRRQKGELEAQGPPEHGGPAPRPRRTSGAASASTRPGAGPRPACRPAAGSPGAGARPRSAARAGRGLRRAWARLSPRRRYFGSPLIIANPTSLELLPQARDGPPGGTSPHPSPLLAAPLKPERTALGRAPPVAAAGLQMMPHPRTCDPALSRAGPCYEAQVADPATCREHPEEAPTVSTAPIHDSKEAHQSPALAEAHPRPAREGRRHPDGARHSREVRHEVLS